ncbi:hypothetical protein [uncultured Gammaproteobacteria bacterium]|nr:hypothetical protein [uncultured Gammaproteobacteria bacterium]CAC9544550.1 hypothetical protein [uncultured Gammaproteobacteria bacterium]
MGLLFQSFCSKYRRADSSVGNLSNSSNVLMVFVYWVIVAP